MNLQQITHFLALAETGSFSRAAEQVHLTQPALSRSIAQLESELNGPLFERLGRSNHLTPVGQLVAARARRIQQELAELKRSSELVQSEAAGQVSLGLAPTPFELLGAPLMRHFAEHHPRLKLTLGAGSHARQIEGLRRRHLDALVIHERNVQDWAGLQAQHLPPLRIGLICRAGHPLAAARPLKARQLADYPLAASGAGLSPEILREMKAYTGADFDLAQQLHFRADQVSALFDVVRFSDVVFFGVVEVWRRWLDRNELVELSLPRTLNLSSRFAFVTLEGAAWSPALQRVHAFIVGPVAA